MEEEGEKEVPTGRKLNRHCSSEKQPEGSKASPAV